jgi:hypothetical protein
MKSVFGSNLVTFHGLFDAVAATSSQPRENAARAAVLHRRSTTYLGMSDHELI